MHDIRAIRNDPAAFDAGLARRGLPPQAAALIALDERRRAAATEAQEAQNRRNAASKAIGQAMASGAADEAEALKTEVAAIKQRLPELEAEEREAGAALDAALAVVPNLPADDVPEGADEQANREIARWGTPRQFDFTPQEHADLGPALGMDFETGAALSGARFTFLRGPIARLHRALGQFML
ncbi:MAG: serine--tRNA ligase, partial [Pelagerythrobacter marensis]